MQLVIRWYPPKWHFRSLATWMNRICCGIVGHHTNIVVAEHSVALRCLRCGWRSCGWHLNGRVGGPPRLPAMPGTFATRVRRLRAS
jgi:hypothetical protein